MRDICHSRILRIASLLCILLSLFLLVYLNTPDTGGTKDFLSPQRSEYHHEINEMNRSIPVYSGLAESFFLPAPATGAGVKTAAPVQAEEVSIPPLQFVGMIETGEKVIFSFRDTSSNRLLLLEKGEEKDGITLIARNKSEFILNKDKSTFKVDMK